MNAPPVRILLVDDHFMVRLGLIGAFQAERDLSVVGEARTGAEAIETFAKLTPDVTLMDGLLPDMHGVDAMRRILEAHPDARIIIVSINETAEDVYRAMQAGAYGYVPKSCEKDTIARAVREAAAGRRFLTPEISRRMADRSRQVGLSMRELDVLRLIAQGKANKEIAAQLGLSEATVKTHIGHIFFKLDATDRTRAVTIALERGLLR